MNPILEAKGYVVSAHRMLNEHGLGHKKLVLLAINNAIRALKQAERTSDALGIDAAQWELARAREYVNDGDDKEAIKCLLFVEKNNLEPILQAADTKSVVEKLINSVFPWEGYRDRQ